MRFLLKRAETKVKYWKEWCQILQSYILFERIFPWPGSLSVRSVVFRGRKEKEPKAEDERTYAAYVRCGYTMNKLLNI